jgi:hypothetical protein
LLFNEENTVVRGETREKWQELCAKAAEEQDPDRLLELIAEINRLLEAKEERLKRQRANQYETQAAD